MIGSTRISLGALLVSCLALHAHAHAAIAPALGVQGNPVRADVQRPSTAEPCGTIPISDINTSTAVPLGADGSADFTVTNFNAGTDGSREVSAQVDPTGTGKSFEAATVTTNGDGDPTNVGSQPLVVQLPAGIQCKGGDAGNLCLMSFKTTSGFGNCAVVSQGAGAGAGAAPGGAKDAAAAAGTAAAAGSAAGAAKAKDATAGSANNDDNKKDAAKVTVAAADATATVADATATAPDATATPAAKDGAKGKKAHHHKGEKGKKGKGKGGEATATATAAADDATATVAADAKTANAPAGARAVRSFLGFSEGETIAKRGLSSWSWVWA